MPEHQQTQKPGKPDSTFQKQTALTTPTHVSHPASIIQRARINPKSLTAADVLQLQRTIGNRAVGRLLSEIRNSSKVQQVPIQRQEVLEEEKEPLQGMFGKKPEEETCPSCVQRQEKPEEEEPLQGKFETIQRLEPEEEEKLQMKSVVQRQDISEGEEPLQGKMADPVQCQEIPEEAEPIQGKMIGTIQRQEIPEEEPLQKKSENNTGMPDNLKAGVENLSGIDMSDVRVHYNSDKPAQVGALAYTQGTNIHVAPGQERHLPHEAWHVVQQKQGRVKPTMQMKGIVINDDMELEKEADVVGTKVFTTGQNVFFRQEAYKPWSLNEQESFAHELIRVRQQNQGVMQPIQAKIIQMLRHKTSVLQININTLSFFRVLDYLRRPDPDPDPGGVYFDPGDKNQLQLRSDELYPQVFQSIFNLLGEAEVNHEKENRNISPAVNFQEILTIMRTRHQAGTLPGFREWLAGVEVNRNVLNVVDKLNELRTAQNIDGVVNVDETQIPGTNQTADLQHGNSQTEVKTIRQPIRSYTDFTGQVSAALAKFANVDPADGRTYNATVYCSIDQSHIAGITTNRNGNEIRTQINPANLDKITTITRIRDGSLLNQQIENQLDRLLHNLNTLNWPGSNLTHNINLVVENGAMQQLSRNQGTNQWQKR